ncbi:hypothetical protein FRUB_09531 [Fimbriiglobus ruber]|uniref:Uncharacterized protein n=1 Tax=Fimbriiglobus ruber TaxID=1908690 RepID=A0A225DC17_9BACT|nr:hypothetical protein FRUB_09531 [Fimbriiglobus ruber]
MCAESRHAATSRDSLSLKHDISASKTLPDRAANHTSLHAGFSWIC